LISDQTRPKAGRRTAPAAAASRLAMSKLPSRPIISAMISWRSSGVRRGDDDRRLDVVQDERRIRRLLLRPVGRLLLRLRLRSVANL
jgi:hypothetical protein